MTKITMIAVVSTAFYTFGAISGQADSLGIFEFLCFNKQSAAENTYSTLATDLILDDLDPKLNVVRMKNVDGLVDGSIGSNSISHFLSLQYELDSFSDFTSSSINFDLATGDTLVVSVASNIAFGSVNAGPVIAGGCDTPDALLYGSAFAGTVFVRTGQLCERNIDRRPAASIEEVSFANGASPAVSLLAGVPLLSSGLITCGLVRRHRKEKRRRRVKRRPKPQV